MSATRRAVCIRRHSFIRCSTWPPLHTRKAPRHATKCIRIVYRRRRRTPLCASSNRALLSASSLFITSEASPHPTALPSIRLHISSRTLCSTTPHTAAAHTPRTTHTSPFFLVSFSVTYLWRGQANPWNQVYPSNMSAFTSPDDWILTHHARDEHASPNTSSSSFGLEKDHSVSIDTLFRSRTSSADCTSSRTSSKSNKSASRAPHPAKSSSSLRFN